VGPYGVERVVGRGGMGVVYLARREDTGAVVALKVLRAGVSEALAPTESRLRFLREIRFGERLRHPGLVPVIDSGEDDGRLWFAMPFVDGETLRERVKRDGRLALPVAASIGRQIAEALAWLAERGIVHRDVKPDNVLVARAVEGDGGADAGDAGTGVRAVLADLGVARAFDIADADGRLTSTGVLVGTVRYMSPEQIRGEPIDASTDVFSLGVVLYEALAGEPPYSGATQRILLRRVPGRPADTPDVLRLRPDVPAAMADALRRALSPDPGDRPTAAALAHTLASVA
jgi:eukaryotic-like serine/threonine-protein kinase